jgi:hypothetical protein
VNIPTLADVFAAFFATHSETGDPGVCVDSRGQMLREAVADEPVPYTLAAAAAATHECPGHALHRADRPGHADVPSSLVPGAQAAPQGRMDRLAPRRRRRQSRSPGRHESSYQGGEPVTLFRQMALWPELDRTGPRGFPLCQACDGEGIGPGTPWCYRCWSPERDPEGAASARALGLLPSPVPSLTPIAADPSGRRVLSRDGEAGPEDAVGAPDGFRRTRTIPAAGSGNPAPSLFKHPARGHALVSLPRTGLVSPAMTRRSHR